MKLNWHTSKHRFLIAGALAVLFLASVGELFILYRVLSLHERLDAVSTLNFIQNRIAGHLEILKFIPQPPSYLKNLAWLTDELQGQPFLVGVIVTQGQKTLLNTFPEGVVPGADVLNKCWQGLEEDQVFYLCRDTLPLPHQHLFILIGLDASIKQHIWRQGVFFCFIVFLVASGLLLLLGFYIERLIKREEDLSRKLLASERLATMGKLAAMVAHEIRNPLNALAMGLQYMQTLGELRPDILQDIQGELRRLTELSEELLSLSHGFQIHPQEVSLEDLLAEIKTRFLPKASQKGISLEIKAPKDLYLWVDKRWFLRALENLLRNALEAMKEGGKLSLEVQEHPHGLLFLIKDTGPGIPPEIQAHLFEPFYTTKKEGFGLGLFIVQKVVEGHGGRIEVKSAPQKGTLFKIFLPRPGR